MEREDISRKQRVNSVRIKRVLSCIRFVKGRPRVIIRVRLCGLRRTVPALWTLYIRWLIYTLLSVDEQNCSAAGIYVPQSERPHCLSFFFSCYGRFGKFSIYFFLTKQKNYRISLIVFFKYNFKLLDVWKCKENNILKYFILI